MAESSLPLIIRIIAGVQLLASAITPFVFAAIIYAIIRMYYSKAHNYYLLVIGSSTLVWIFKISMIFFASKSLKMFVILVYGFVLHTVTGVFCQTYNIFHALATMTDLKWGLTRKVV